jgi:hypothetical protein
MDIHKPKAAHSWRGWNEIGGAPAQESRRQTARC